MAQYFIPLNQRKINFLLNSTNSDFEHFIVFRKVNDTVDRLFMSAFSMENGNFRGIDLEPNQPMTTVSENSLEIQMFNPRQNIFSDPPEFELVYIPRSEIIRLVRVLVDSGESNPRLYFTHSRVDYLKQTPTGVSNRTYMSLSVMLTSGSSEDPRDHGVGTAIVQGIPCPPKWDEGVENFVHMNSLSVIPPMTFVPFTNFVL